MKKLTLLCLFLILASSVLAADVKYTYIDSSCDEEGRGIFYFIIDHAEQEYSADEARISGIEADWYDCSSAHCGYDYYESPPDAPSVDMIKSGREFNLITEPLAFVEEKRYTLDFVYPTMLRVVKVMVLHSRCISLQRELTSLTR
jgi:hypothetical protein